MHDSGFSYSNIEAPSAGAILSPGWHQLRGWIFPQSGGHFVDVRARVGERIFPGVHGFPRADLAAHFKTGRPFSLAEFYVVIAVEPGPVNVVLEALEIEGRWSAFQTVSYQVTPASQPAEFIRPIGQLRTHEFGRAVRILLRTHAHRPDIPLADLVHDFVALIPTPRDLRQPHPPFRGFLDEPSAIVQCGFGRVPVKGWLFHETQPIKHVFASFDLQVWQTIKHGLPSSALGASQPHFSQAANCGVLGNIDLPAQLPGPACLRLYAELADGSLHLCSAQRVLASVEDEGKWPYPALSPILFLRLIQALRTALLTRGGVIESGPAWRREIWQQWRKYTQQAPQRTQNTTGALQESSRLPQPDKPLGRVMLFTHNLDIEGAPLLFLEYAQQLAAHDGTQLTVISGKDGPLRAKFEGLGAKVQIAAIGAIAGAQTTHAWRDAFRQLSRAIDCRSADLVVANTLACYWGIHLAHAARRPSIFYIHESTTPAAFLANNIPQGMLPFMEEAFGLATRVSFNTAHTSRYYEPFAKRSNYWCNHGWISLAALDQHRREHTRGTLRQTLGLPADKQLVINLGTVCERKGQHIFARAVDLLWRRHPALAANCEFWMVGGRDSAFDAVMADLLAQLDRPNLRLIPETQRAYDYLGSADLFVCSSFEESFPRVVLEAMSLEVPIVSTWVHGIPEIARHEQEAILVPPGDSSTLADALARVLQDPVLAAALARQARNRVEKNFDATTILPRQLGFAQEVIATQQAG